MGNEDLIWIVFKYKETGNDITDIDKIVDVNPEYAIAVKMRDSRKHLGDYRIMQVTMEWYKERYNQSREIMLKLKDETATMSQYV